MPENHTRIPSQLSSFFAEPLFMTQEAFLGFMAELNTASGPASFFWGDDLPTYQDETKKLAAQISSEEISVTSEFYEHDIPDGSIALHRIRGSIIADRSRWWFSTMRFVDDLKAAEENPQIIAHLLMINSGGGEAWYLEKAHQAVRECQKPVIAFIEKNCCSAAYYIGSSADRVFTSTINDCIGSIGVMLAFWDFIPYYESIGFKWIEVYADQSKLKNKDYNDLLKGKPKREKEKWLNPLAGQFVAAVRGARESLAALPEDHDVFAGDVYRSETSESVGLIDEIADLEQVLQYTHSQGMQWRSRSKMNSQIQNYIE